MLTQGRDGDQESPDPLVMLAWKCKNLEHLTLMGKQCVCSGMIPLNGGRSHAKLEGCKFLLVMAEDGPLIQNTEVIYFEA